MCFTYVLYLELERYRVFIFFIAARLLSPPLAACGPVGLFTHVGARDARDTAPSHRAPPRPPARHAGPPRGGGDGRCA